MFCKNCGAVLEDDAVFCEKCGTKIKRGTVSDDSVREHQESSNDSLLQNCSPRPIKVKKKRHTALIVIIVIIIILLVLAAAFVGVLHFKPDLLNLSAFGSKVDPCAECNFNNGGHMAYDDSRLYFIGLYNEGDDDECLYSTSYSGDDKKLISDTPGIGMMRIVNNSIIYFLLEGDKYSICKMDKDGANNSTIIQFDMGDDHLWDFDATDTKLYYSVNNELRYCNFDGSDDTLVLPNALEFVLVDNMIYYNTDEGIFSYNTKTKVSNSICYFEAKYLVYDEGKIYFSNDTGLYYVDASGEDITRQLETYDKENKYTFYDGNIYYIKQFSIDERDELISQIDPTGSNTLGLYFALLGTGTVMQLPQNGGVAEPTASSQLCAYSLYTYPEGLYESPTFYDNSFSSVWV